MAAAAEEIELPTRGEPTLLKSYQSLYSADTRAEYISGNRLSTGEPIDAVLAWKLPADKEDREKLLKEAEKKRGLPMDNDSPVAHVFFREYYEGMLANKFIAENLAEAKAELDRCRDATRKAELASNIELMRKQLASTTLKLETELGQDGITVFVKISAPFETLCHAAEEVHLVLPLKPSGRVLPTPPRQTLADRIMTLPLLRSFHVADIPDDSVYCGEFKAAFRDRFINSDRPELLFTPAHRSMLVFRILQATRYERLESDASNSEHLGINRMLRKGMYAAAYPLHDSSANKAPPADASQERYLLAQTWAKWGLWWKDQPLLRIRRYFGEKVAFYFLWLGFYTRMLIPAAFVGLFIFIYGLSTYKDQDDAKELCASSTTICGLCSTCVTWTLSTSCEVYQFGWVFDNGGTVFFAFFMALWATFFLEFWKRETATKAYEWDVSKFEENEPRRPEFRAVAMRPDPVTQELSPYFPSGARTRRFIASCLVILLMLTLVIWAVIAVIMFRLAVQVTLYDRYENLRNSAAAITSALAAVLNLITIVVLSMIYNKLAFALTEWENFEKQTEYEQALSLKVSLFQFVNSYASIFYIAYFKGQFVGRPGSRGELFGVRQEDCPQYGCMMELTIQLAIIMVGKQAIGNMTEIIIPWIKEHIMMRLTMRRIKGGEEAKKIVTRWERHFLMEPYEGQFAEYLEMVIQFGFVTLFVAAFPLAPLCALANNLLEIRLDAYKMVQRLRRPFGERAEDIGVWYDILLFLSYVAVISNAFVIAIPSAFIPKLVFYYNNDKSMTGYIAASYAPSPLTTGTGSDVNCFYKGFRNADGTYSRLHYEIMMARMAFIICFEHAVFLAKFLFAYLIPDVPKNVRLAMKREEHEARLALEKSLLGAHTEPAPTIVLNN